MDPHRECPNTTSSWWTRYVHHSRWVPVRSACTAVNTMARAYRMLESPDPSWPRNLPIIVETMNSARNNKNIAGAHPYVGFIRMTDEDAAKQVCPFHQSINKSIIRLDNHRAHANVQRMRVRRLRARRALPRRSRHSSRHIITHFLFVWERVL